MAPPIVRPNDSDLCPIGINHSESTSATTISRRREVSVDPPTLPLSNVPLETRTARKPSCNIPYDIAEMIIALTLDLRDLKACSLTCHSWYIAAIPHLHRTLTLRGNSKVIRDKLKPLPELHELGLIPLVKELRVEQEYHLGGWFVPQAFSHNDLRCFSAFKNVHTLKLRRVEIYRFIPVINRYFGSFSPTLRSIALYNPNCTPQQLSHFLSFFLNLEDIEIERINTSVPDTTVPDTELFPFPIPRLQGRLALRDFRWAETWTSLIASCGGLRFRHIDLRANVTCAPALLEACAGTLETLRFHAMDVTYSKFFAWVYLQIRADDEQDLLIYRGSESSDLYRSPLGWVVMATQDPPVMPSSRRFSQLSHLLCSPSSLLSSRATR